jgi:hypothetical protein
MTEGEAIQAVRQHFESLFPKVCPNCGRRFATLREYILTTTRTGSAVSYDADLGDWNPSTPLGSQALANCSCGSTLALTTDGMALPRRLELLGWVRSETERRGVGSSAVLERLRDGLRKQVLGDPTP